MVTGRGNPKGDPTAAPIDPDEAEDSESGGPLTAIPELMRRALGLGLSGFFLTEEAFRKALGDALPKDWIDFAADQSQRARAEFVERLSFEIGRALESADLAGALASLLEGRTLEIKAQIRLGSQDSRARSSKQRGSAAPEGEDDGDGR